MFIGFIVEPSKFIPFMQRQFLANGGNLVLKKVEDLDELFEEGFEVVVNCTGLDSGRLLKDDQVKAVRGQIARVSRG